MPLVVLHPVVVPVVERLDGKLEGGDQGGVERQVGEGMPMLMIRS